MERKHMNEYEKDLLVKLLTLQFKDVWFEDLEEIFEKVRMAARGHIPIMQQEVQEVIN